MVLGPTGRNFAAGMSGGIAYILDEDDSFAARCNMGMVALESMEAEADINELKTLIEKHERYTGSPVAQRVLANWEQMLPRFVKVMPLDYKRVLEERAAKEADGELRAVAG